jgi:arabinose operon protein AraL
MYNAYLSDLDGTIYLSDTLLSGAAETVAVLRAAGGRTIFLSNTPPLTRQQYAMKLTSLGIPASAEHIMNSSFVPVQCSA